MAIYQVILCVIYVWSITKCEGTERKTLTLHQLSEWPYDCMMEPGYKVDCSGRHLTKVPENLSNKTIILLLKDNWIERLFDSSFIHVPQLEELDVSFNRISTIDYKTFSNLRHLLRLDLSGNPIGVKNLGRVFCNFLSVKVLHLKGIRFKDIKSDSFQCLQNTSVRSIDASDSYYLCQGAPGIFSNISQLSFVRLSNSRCQKFNALLFENDINIAELQLSENKIIHFPTFERNGKPVLMNIQNLNLSYNFISTLPPSSLLGLNSLKILDLSHNFIELLIANGLAELKSLEQLDIYNNRIFYIEEEALKSDTLKIVNIRVNPINFTGTGKTAFKYTTAIEVIRMEGTRFIPSEFKEMFQNISTLKEVSLHQMAGFRYIPHYTFRGLFNLQSLFLSGNQIEEIYWFQFKDLISLEKLALDSNEITTINVTSLPKFLFHNIKKFYLENNPFHCSCGLLWFKDWMQSKSQEKGWHKENIYCVLPEYKLLTDMHLTATTCLYKPISRLNLALWGFSTLLSVAILLLSCYRRFRWHIRYNLFSLTLWMKTPRKYQVMDSNVHYTFDVFVCYNGEDSAWVMNVLVPEVEMNSEPPLKLCLFERNWMPGNDIVTLIGESIEASRKVLIVLTNAFAQSEWCQLELTMAQQHMIEDDKENIVLVVMEELDSENITPRLLLEMKQRTYLEWTDDETGQKLFWQKLKYTLQKQNLSFARAVPQRDVFL